MTDFNNSNNKEESVQDTLRRVMTERGYFANPVTLHTEIGDFTSYADDDSPLVKKNQPQLNAHNPFEPQAEIQVKPPFSSAYQGKAYNNNSQNPPAQQSSIYSTNNQSLIGRPISNFETANSYLVPKEVYTDSNWGQQTAAKLDEYMQNYNSYPGITHTGIAAPFHDMWRNYKIMKDEQNWTGGDNFFHCKANYEAAKRGPWGEIVGKTVSVGREMWGQVVKEDPLSDLRKDWHANRMGWQGAKKGLSLQQSCPTNPKAYVNPDDYDDIF